MDYFLMFGAILIILFSFVTGYVVGHADGSREALLEKKSPDNKHETEE